MIVPHSSFQRLAIVLLVAIDLMLYLLREVAFFGITLKTAEANLTISLIQSGEKVIVSNAK
jgi:hypothetical protein